MQSQSVLRKKTKTIISERIDKNLKRCKDLPNQISKACANFCVIKLTAKIFLCVYTIYTPAVLDLYIPLRIFVNI